MRPLLLAAALLLLAPAIAEATYWRGKTEQGRIASVRTGADNHPTSVRIFWKAPCRPGRYRDATRFIRPLDASAPYAFEDGGTYGVRLGDGYRARVKVFVRGQISENLRRWTGSFRARARIIRNGRRVDTCRVRGVRWRARLRS